MFYCIRPGLSLFVDLTGLPGVGVASHLVVRRCAILVSVGFALASGQGVLGRVAQQSVRPAVRSDWGWAGRRTRAWAWGGIDGRRRRRGGSDRGGSSCFVGTVVPSGVACTRATVVLVGDTELFFEVGPRLRVGVKRHSRHATSNKPVCSMLQ
jgi:hypothetical protein